MSRKLIQIAVNIFAVILGLIIFSAGMSKLYFLHQFPKIIGPVNIEEQLAEFGLSLLAQCIAYSQVIIGFILITLMFRTLGAILLTPMIFMICVVTISFEMYPTNYLVAIMLVLNLLILMYDWKKFAPILGYEYKGHPIKHHGNIRIYELTWLLGLGLSLFSIHISYYDWLIAYSLVFLGVAISLWSHYKRNKLSTTKNKAH